MKTPLQGSRQRKSGYKPTVRPSLTLFLTWLQTQTPQNKDFSKNYLHKLVTDFLYKCCHLKFPPSIQHPKNCSGKCWASVTAGRRQLREFGTASAHLVCSLFF